MTKKILIFLIANLIFIGVVYGIYAVGYEYDRSHNLFKESKDFGDWSMYAYGQRWERFCKVLLYAGAMIDFVIVLIWYVTRQKQSNITSVLGIERQ
jgi:hypothetical protein